MWLDDELGHCYGIKTAGSLAFPNAEIKVPTQDWVGRRTRLGEVLDKRRQRGQGGQRYDEGLLSKYDWHNEVEKLTVKRRI
jgi:hypothetical protein